MASALPSLEHVVRLSDDTGIIQHAIESVPNRSTGYCTDDVARAFIVAIARARLMPADDAAASIASTSLAFLHDAQLADGRFHNFMSYERTWLDNVGTQDSCGRAIWALGYGMRFAPDAPSRRVAQHLLNRTLQTLDWLAYPRAEAYAILGLHHAALADASPGYRTALAALSRASIRRFDEAAVSDWPWFEDVLTYDNARLPEALLRAAFVLEDARAREVGHRALAFLESIVVERGIFVPIGNDGWYPRHGERSRYAQQPLEAVAMVDAELAAFALDREPRRLIAAERAHAWYEGKNSLGVRMANGAGCYDGLEPSGPNRNMGAESTLAYLASAYVLAEHRAASLRIAR